MFGLLIVSLLCVPVYAISKFWSLIPDTSYDLLEIEAVGDGRAYQINDPSDIPDMNIDYFRMRYSVGDEVFAVCRHSVTVPTHLRKRKKNIGAMELVKALSIDELGQVREVTSKLAPFSGMYGDFSGHDISVPDILKEVSDIKDASFIVTITRPRAHSLLHLLLRKYGRASIGVHTRISHTKVL